ncbi:DUF547 domain-containing protein [Aquimarina agarivorans]|uniref:DUF547 domain-containing protein n=1 Tax=Aquimarina agarivorans TaxID=980584 RepID=UPI000248ED07|nr:DUF547 domain-containing protein [Aquimarina agarivorans]
MKKSHLYIFALVHLFLISCGKCEVTSTEVSSINTSVSKTLEADRVEAKEGVDGTIDNTANSITKTSDVLVAEEAKEIVNNVVDAKEEILEITTKDVTNVKSEVEEQMESATVKEPNLEDKDHKNTLGRANKTELEKLKMSARGTESNSKAVLVAKSDSKIKVDALETIDHKPFDDFLKKYVSASGFVNYNTMKGNRIELENYIISLQKNQYNNSWTRNEKLAYWINVYNAFTLKLILDHYPIKSITDIANGKAWDKKWIQLNNEIYSLNQIENDIIRPQFKEPRIHFAVNCAAKSCPKLGNFAYTATNLNSKLERQTKAFINSNQNEIDNNEVKISKIFEWYKNDFGALIPFLNTYTAMKINNEATISFKEYDWSLNGK